MRGRKKNQLQKHHLQRTLDTVKVILSLLALSARRAGQGQLLGQRGDPGEPGARAPLSAVLHGADGGQRPGGLPTRAVAAARGVWDYLSSLPLSGAVCSGDLSGRLSSAHEAKCPRLLIHSCL